MSPESLNDNCVYRACYNARLLVRGCGLAINVEVNV